MKKNMGMVLLLAGCFSLPLFAGGAQESAGLSGGAAAKTFTSVTVTDFLGRTVTIDKPVESIVFTHFSSAEAVKILGAWNMVVGRSGRTGDSAVFHGLENIPALNAPMEGPYTPNMEKLLELSPDLFILEVIPMPGIEELLNQLKGIIPVVTVKTYEPDDMVESFRNLGALLGREEEAEEYIGWSLAARGMMLDRTGHLGKSQKTTLFYKTAWSGPEDLMTFSDDMSYMPARNRIAGCINVAADLPSQGGWVPQIDPEWMATADYDMLLIGDSQYDKYGISRTETQGLHDYRDMVMGNPVFAESAAVKEGRVYMLAESFFGTPRHVIGFAYIAKWCHPDLFEDFSPRELHQEYLGRFLGVDIDLDRQGVFTYPVD